MSFVNSTCARSGAFAKGRFDRNGLNLYWKDHVVLKVSDFAVGREGFEVTYDGRTEYGAVRAKVTFNRIKRRYHERYAYGNSITPGAQQASSSTQAVFCIWYTPGGRAATIHSSRKRKMTSPPLSSLCPDRTVVLCLVALSSPPTGELQ